MFNEYFELPLNESDNDSSNRKTILSKVEKILDKNDIKYKITAEDKKKFINNETNLYGDCKLCISVNNDITEKELSRLCSTINKELIAIGGHVKRDNYNTLFLSYNDSMTSESVITEDLKSAASNIRSKIKNKLDALANSTRVMTKLEASKKYSITSDKDTKEIKQYIKKISDEAIKIFNEKNIVTKKEYNNICKYYMNGNITEQYLYDAKNNDAYHQITCTPIAINIINKNISEKEFKTIENIIWKDLYEEIDNYINNLKCKFNIYASPETHDNDKFGKQKIYLRIEYFQKLKPKSSVKEDINYNKYLNNTDAEYQLYNESVEESDILCLPGIMDDLRSILDNTDSKHIYLTSDWHLFKNHYKHETNYVNTQKIITWCRQNIKDDDVFIYLGDISFRWITEEDKKESMRIMSSLPGIKVLIAGNHDRMLGDEYCQGCGFKYIFDQYTWNNIIFTHRPINMTLYTDDYWNIHGHIHNLKKYNTTDGKKNINVYPMFYDNKPVTLDYILKHKEELVKDNCWNPNDILSETKRSELPDSAFGIPEDRKYPLDTEQHVRSAIKLFGHAEENKKKSLAKSIRSAAKKYDIRIPETTQCYKYLSEGGIESIIPDNIRAVVFDMDSVLVDFTTRKTIIQGLPIYNYLARKIYDFIEENLLHAQTKEKDLWSVDQMKKYIKSIAPGDMVVHIDRVFELLQSAIYKYPYTDELIDTLKSKGYMIYYLSNWPRWSYELEEDFFRPLLDKFDGGLFSFESKYWKPQPEFYEELFNKYNLDPKNCIFFDDKYENVSAAEGFGMKGVLFNYKETPKLLLADNFNIPSNADNTILVDTGLKLESVDLNKINWWYCSSKNNDNCPCKELFHKSLNDCINAIDSIEFNDDNPIEKYVFICNGDNNDFTCIPVGKIIVQHDRNFEWEIQYPLEYNNGIYVSVLNEWSMASCNPIQGITKPFICKLCNDSGSIISTKQYAFSPDIISDKYLVISENAQLEIIDANKFKDKFKDYYIEVYEFIGNKAYINKLNEAYKTGKIVDNTVFYTTLTGKPMLCEDQIDFDTNFKKVDFEYLKEDALSKLATMRDEFLEIKEYDTLWQPLIESNYTNKIPFINKYNKYGDISIKEDFDGYYFYSSLTNKRSSSVPTISSMSEAMIKSIL